MAGKPARTGRKRPKSDLKSMKIAARHNIDARVAAKAASGRVIQMILRPQERPHGRAESSIRPQADLAFFNFAFGRHHGHVDRKASWRSSTDHASLGWPCNLHWLNHACRGRSTLVAYCNSRVQGCQARASGLTNRSSRRCFATRLNSIVRLLTVMASAERCRDDWCNRPSGFLGSRGGSFLAG